MPKNGGFHDEILATTLHIIFKKISFDAFFGRNRSFKELHQSSYAQEISKNLSKRLLNASRVQTNDLLKQFDTHLTGLTEEQAYTQQITVGLNEVTHEKPLTWWQHLWYCYRNPFNILLSLLGVCHPKSVPRNWPEL